MTIFSIADVAASHTVRNHRHLQREKKSEHVKERGFPPRSCILESGFARVFLVQHTKMGKNTPINLKFYQMATVFTKRP
jgi:hypothetical protein